MNQSMTGLRSTKGVILPVVSFKNLLSTEPYEVTINLEKICRDKAEKEPTEIYLMTSKGKLFVNQDVYDLLKDILIEAILLNKEISENKYFKKKVPDCLSIRKEIDVKGKMIILWRCFINALEQGRTLKELVSILQDCFAQYCLIKDCINKKIESEQNE